MKLKTLLLLVFLWCVLPIAGRRLTGVVLDKETGKTVIGATVELLSPADSTLLLSDAVKEYDTGWGGKVEEFRIENVQNHTTYLVRVRAVGYETLWDTVRVRMGDKVAEQRMPTIYLKPDSKMLSELVVKATKVKMVLHGDTLVFNADAFQLREGSMLDALVRQLPGATIEQGVIKINGRTVNSLLIDGKDFFKGDAKTALQNLPAYTVDQIKAYERQGEEARFTGIDTGEKEYVLDVNLKKQYKQGLLANVQGGAGTKDRYTGKVFVMGYTKKQRLTLLGNANNMNDGMRPGEDMEINSNPTGTGLMATKMLGVDYWLGGKKESDELTLSGTVQSTSAEDRTRTARTRFLPGGDTYGFGSTLNLNDNTNYMFDGSWQHAFGSHLLSLQANVSQSPSHSRSENRDAVLSQEPSVGASVLDSVFGMESNRDLLRQVINTTAAQSMGKTTSTNYGVSFQHTIRQENEDDAKSAFGYSAAMNKSTSHYDTYSLNEYRYPSSGSAEDLRNQYSDQSARKTDYRLRSYYTYSWDIGEDKLVNISPQVVYNFSYNSSHDSRALYRLDRLAEYGVRQDILGMLPSERVLLLKALDRTNSYGEHMRTTEHSARTLLTLRLGDRVYRPEFRLSLGMQWKYQQEHLRYERMGIHDIRRTNMEWQPQINMSYEAHDSLQVFQVYGSFSRNVHRPPLESLLDIRSDENPLYRSVGSPDLKNAYDYNASFMLNKNNIRRHEWWAAMIYWGVMRHAIAVTNEYDRSTGVTTARKQNVDGNWGVQSNGWWGKTIGSYYLGANFNLAYRHTVDLTSENGGGIVRSSFDQWQAVVAVRGEKKWDKFSVQCNYECALSHTTGNREGFARTVSWNHQVSNEINWELPQGFTLNSGMQVRLRRGLSMKELNTTDWVWNAQISKSLLKEQLYIMLQGYDLLHRLKTTSVNIDEQGRTETWNNAIPSFVMLRLSYRFTLGMQR